MKLIILALADIKPVYYPGEEKLASLDVLKLYRGEDVIRQNPEDIDPDQWVEEGELTELLEVHRTEAKESLGNKTETQGISEANNGPYLEIQINPEEPGTIAVREGIHERIQAEIQYEAKEADAMAEKMLRSARME